MQTQKWVIPIIIYLILSGCANNSLKENTENETAEGKYSIIHTTSSHNQSPANEVKNYINDREEFSEIYVVNTDSQVLIAITPKHHERFRLADFRKELEKDIKDEIDPLEIELSTDKKIAIELKELEEKLEKKSISKKQLEKEFKRIVKLSKEET